MILEVKVIPYASKNEILHWEGNRLVMKIRGVPEKGKVNETLVAFLAKTLGVAKSQIEMIAGKGSRFKKLNIQGVSVEQLKNLSNTDCEK